MVKQALKRRNPGFNETYYGFRAFSDLLEEAGEKGLIRLEPDEKSGGYIIQSGPVRAQITAAAGRGIRDVIAPRLKVLFVGINPGLYSAATGHHFARPGNRFWPALHRGGFTPRQLHPSEQGELLRYGYGITNLVNRGTATADELAPEEFVAGRRRLAAKVRRHRPEDRRFSRRRGLLPRLRTAQCAGRTAARHVRGRDVWVLPNPSGLNANYQLPALIQLFRQLWQQSSKDR